MIHKKSFTLIEMLIVVVIIGILAAALIPRLQSVQARARDTKRKADLHQIATALAIYKQDNDNYSAMQDNRDVSTRNGYGNTRPITNEKTLQDCDNGYCNDIHVRSIQDAIKKYMTSLPEDPQMDSYRSALDFGIFGYALGIVKRSSNWDSIILGARTESDGSSSNWVTNNEIVGGGYSIATGNDENGRLGAIGGIAPASIYETYMCNKVMLSGATNNYGDGTCDANRNGNDLRYIYVQ